jgi:hypothetical protein
MWRGSRRSAMEERPLNFPTILDVTIRGPVAEADPGPADAGLAVRGAAGVVRLPPPGYGHRLGDWTIGLCAVATSSDDAQLSLPDGSPLRLRMQAPSSSGWRNSNTLAAPCFRSRSKSSLAMAAPSCVFTIRRVAKNPRSR